jgi:hypothetical protein
MVMALGTSTAWASDGRIGFSGAVVEPTCRIDQQSPDMTSLRASSLQVSPHVACAGPSGVTSAVPQAYTLTVTRLSAATPDRLLQYFAGYLVAGSAGVADARMVTQTYD